MANNPGSDGLRWISGLFKGVWELKLHFLIPTVLAGIATYFFNHQWPEHPIQVEEFIVLWIVMLIPAIIIIALWRRIVG